MSTALRAAEAVFEEQVGLRPSAATEPRLASSLERRARARGLDLETYVERLSVEPDEREALLDLVTVQETSFFRDSGQFDALVRSIVPKSPAPVIVWSAGCATGQEPYSVAMALDEAGVRDWWVIASDVSAHACAHTRAAVYRESELRGLSAARAGRYMRRVDGGWQVVPELRERVSVVHQNIAVDAPPVGRGDCTAVFCRNVFIYLSRARVRACLDRIHERLRPGGALFLGGSETLAADDRFTAVRIAEVFAFTRRERDREQAPSAPVTTSKHRSASQAVERQPLPTSAELRRAGESAARAGNHAEAAAAFRRALYLDGDDMAAHLGLAFSLEGLGHVDASRRAFAAAQTALNRAVATGVGADLEGYGAEAVRVVLAAKLSEGGAR